MATLLRSRPLLRDVLLPDLGLGDVPIVVGTWHAKHRRVVIQGDALVEVCAGGILVDIPAPVSGTLHRRCVLTDEPITSGQRLAIIRCDEDSSQSKMSIRKTQQFPSHRHVNLSDVAAAVVERCWAVRERRGRSRVPSSRLQLPTR